MPGMKLTFPFFSRRSHDGEFIHEEPKRLFMSCVDRFDRFDIFVWFGV